MAVSLDFSLVFAAAAAFAVLAASCGQPFDPPPEGIGQGAGRVILTVSAGDAGRTILPRDTPVFSRYELVFSRSGDTDIKISDTTSITGAGVSQELAAGTWTSAVSAYRRFTPTGGSETEYLATRGSASVTVTAGQSTAVTVSIAPLPPLFHRRQPR